MKRFFWAAICLLLGGCAHSVSSQVQVFQDLEPDYQAKTIGVFPFKEQQGDLGFQTYARELEGELRDVGFTVVDPLRVRPDYIAFIGYQIDNGRDVQGSYAIPQYGITGYSSSMTTGTLNTFGNTGTYNGTTTYTPTYGITGWSTGITHKTIFTRVLAIQIYDIRQGIDANSPQVYQATISSAGRCGSLPAVMPAMMHAPFDDFPGPSSGTRTVGSSVSDGEGC